MSVPPRASLTRRGFIDGSLKRPQIPNNEKTRQEEALRVWQSIPTPLYDEFMSKRKATTPGPYNTHLAEDKALFFTYVEKLKQKYPGCKINVTPMVSASGSGMVGQSFEASGGQNYYNLFRDAEKSCQLNQMYNLPQTKKVGQGWRSQTVEIPAITSWQTLMYHLKRLEDEEKERQIKENERKRQEKEERNKEEAKRFASVKQGNLLGLSTKEEPNLLTFGPTKEGLASRANELKNLYVPRQRCNNCGSNVKGSYISHPTFGVVRSCCARASQGGKRITRKTKKSKKTRKVNRK